MVKDIYNNIEQEWPTIIEYAIILLFTMQHNFKISAQ
jgi:hypothetical protein